VVFFPRVAVGRMRNVETVESVLKEYNGGWSWCTVVGLILGLNLKDQE